MEAPNKVITYFFLFFAKITPKNIEHFWGLFSTKIYLVGAYWYCLTKLISLSIHRIYIDAKITEKKSHLKG